MLQVLLESHAHPGSGGIRSALASVFTHLALITAAVVLTLRGASRPDLDLSSVTPVINVWPAAPQTPHQPTLARTGSEPIVPRTLPRIPSFDVRVPTFDPGGFITPADVIGTDPVMLGTINPADVPANGVYTERSVDRAVIPRGNNGSPAYPPSLRAAGLEGDVVVRFVVDSVGRVELSSIEIVRATHPLFGEAARRWLERTRYEPGQAQGRAVRQLVEQRMTFSLTR